MQEELRFLKPIFRSCFPGNPPLHGSEAPLFQWRYLSRLFQWRYLTSMSSRVPRVVGVKVRFLAKSWERVFNGECPTVICPRSFSRSNLPLQAITFMNRQPF